MLFGQTQAHYLQQLPKMMPQWGKVCIGNGGDCICAAITQCDNSKNHETSFVQVHSLHIFPPETSNNSMKHSLI